MDNLSIDQLIALRRQSEKVRDAAQNRINLVNETLKNIAQAASDAAVH